jgi:hypothetical protein
MTLKYIIQDFTAAVWLAFCRISFFLFVGNLRIAVEAEHQ